jgi:hypothetical protein
MRTRLALLVGVLFLALPAAAAAETDLAISGQRTAVDGQRRTAHITVTNNGTDAWTRDVVVNLSYSDYEMQYVSSSVPCEPDPGGRPSRCKVAPSLPPGESAAMDVTMQVAESSRYYTRLGAILSTGESNQSNDRVDIDMTEPPVPGMDLTTSNAAVAYSGASTYLEFTVTNTGNRPLEDVHVKDDLCGELPLAQEFQQSPGGNQAQPGFAIKFHCDFTPPRPPGDKAVVEDHAVATASSAGAALRDEESVKITVFKSYPFHNCGIFKARYHGERRRFEAIESTALTCAQAKRALRGCLSRKRGYKAYKCTRPKAPAGGKAAIMRRPGIPGIVIAQVLRR